MGKNPITTEANCTVNTAATEQPSVRRGRRAAAGPTVVRPTAWWLWPHLWSLDAPLVAVTWQIWWSHCAGISLRWQENVILGVAVWMIYLADRLADVSGPGQPQTDHETARHSFYGRVRTATAGGALTLCLCLVIVTPMWLPQEEFCAGLGLLALAGTYFWMTHRRGKRTWTAILPKEAAVGGLFALGTTAFAWCRVGQVTGPVFLGWLSSAILFFLNCALICRWESCLRDRRDPTSLLNAFPDVVRCLRAGCLGLGLIALATSAVTRRDMLLPMAASAGLLALLDGGQRRFSADARRVLADAALLTPWGFLLFC